MSLLARCRILRSLSSLQLRRFSLKPGIIAYSEEVERARRDGAPLVALESTIITHGMPYPQNLETAIQVENIVREKGAVPATIAILKGQITVGLSITQLGELARSSTAVKTSRRDLAYVVANRLDGATTVAGTVLVSEMADISVFATGGLGGVHRGGQHTLDVSADLTELGRTGVCVVCSGVKSILDIPRTLEFLETQGVLVATYGESRAFPAFYTRRSSSQAPYRFADAAVAARVLAAARALGLRSGMVVAVPIPAHHAVDEQEIELAIEAAMEGAAESGVRGKEVTPFLLSAVARASQGKSLDANIALIKNNASVAAEIAAEFNKLRPKHHSSESKKTPINHTVSRKFHTSHARASDAESTAAGAQATEQRKEVIPGVLLIGGANLDRTCRVTEDDLKGEKPCQGR